MASVALRNIVDRSTGVSSAGYRRLGETAILPPQKSREMLDVPLSPHFRRPFSAPSWFPPSSRRGVAREGTWVNVPRHGLKKISPWITDRWLLCNWCHMPDVTKTKGKCAISTLIFFENFLGAMPPESHTVEGLRRPSADPNPSALRPSAPRLLGTFGPFIVVSSRHGTESQLIDVRWW